MYVVVNASNVPPVDSEHEEFDSALDRAYELALIQASERGMDLDTIFTYYDVGFGVVDSVDGYHDWKAGSAPEGSEGCGWPQVEWRS